MAVYHFTWIVVEITWATDEDTDAGRWFIFLTNQGYMLLVAFQWLDWGMTLYVHVFKKELLEDKGDISMI